MEKGKLYIVATPIGNLGDMTIRSLEVLKSVDLIVSEDTRETSKILNHYQISKPQISYRDQVHFKVYQQILGFLNEGKNLALVSDGGTPLVSDPGFKLVRDLIKENIVIDSLPGPSSVIASLTSSGLPTDKFTFIGFLPKTSHAKQEILKRYGALDATLIIFESPFRFKKLIQEILDTLGNREICIANDLTKLHELLIRGKISDILPSLSKVKEKGEFIILVGKADL